MNLESPKITVNKSSNELFDYLSKVENFEKIMPENTDKFEATEDGFVFALKGMPEIVLKRKSQTPYEKVVLGAASDKLPFSLTADLREATPEETEVNLSFEGEFNAMMAMMIKGPITNFLGTLSEKRNGI